MVTDSERKAYGVLGRPPDSVLFNKLFLKQWSELEVEARKVMRIREVDMREHKARDIERRYFEIVRAAERYSHAGNSQ